MTDIRLSGITIYPVKSCGGIPLQSTRLGSFGPEGDRRWMLVDGAGQFVTQRSLAKLALIATALSDEQLVLTMAERQLAVAVPDVDAARRTVTDVDEFDWGDTPDAADGPGTGNPYPTLAEHDGARHLVGSGLFMGSTCETVLQMLESLARRAVAAVGRQREGAECVGRGTEEIGQDVFVADARAGVEGGGVRRCRRRVVLAAGQPQQRVGGRGVAGVVEVEIGLEKGTLRTARERRCGDERVEIVGGDILDADPRQQGGVAIIRVALDRKRVV